MKQDDFEEKLKNLPKPELEGVAPPVELKLAILGARRSAAVTLWFVLVPAFFLFCVLLKYYFHIDLGFFSAWEDSMGRLDNTPGLKWVWPVVLVGLPLAGIVLNALAITHLSYRPHEQTVVVSIKLKWLNLVLLAVSLCIVGVFFVYLVVENVNHL